MPAYAYKPPIERLNSRIQRVDDAEACFPWIGANDGRSGYGHLMVNGRLVKAHRLTYELLVAPIPIGMQVLHRCDNPPCCNPRHLFIGSHSDNMRDRQSKGRHNAPFGEGHGRAILTEDAVAEIRALYASGAKQNEMARRFGVSTQTIHAIVHRKNWRHIP